MGVSPEPHETVVRVPINATTEVSRRWRTKVPGFGAGAVEKSDSGFPVSAPDVREGDVAGGVIWIRSSEVDEVDLAGGADGLG